MKGSLTIYQSNQKEAEMSKEIKDAEVVEAPKTEVVETPQNDVRGWTVERLESMAYKNIRNINILNKDLATIEQEIVRREQGAK